MIVQEKETRPPQSLWRNAKGDPRGDEARRRLQQPLQKQVPAHRDRHRSEGRAADDVQDPEPPRPTLCQADGAGRPSMGGRHA